MTKYGNNLDKTTRSAARRTLADAKETQRRARQRLASYYEEADPAAILERRKRDRKGME